jgi:outer membrane immunogenic protein
MKKLIIGAALAAGFTTPVMAQNFSGPRVEARAGWDNLGISTNIDGDKESDDKSGVSFGGEAGFDGAFGGNGVLGAYAGLDFATTKDCVKEGTEQGCIKAGRNITVGVRGGFVAGAALIYAKGGYSNGSLKLTYTDTAFPADNFSFSDQADGFHVGGGVEFALGTNSYAKAEYVYTDYNGAEYKDADISASIDARRHQALVGFGVRF